MVGQKNRPDPETACANLADLSDFPVTPTQITLARWNPSGTTMANNVPLPDHCQIQGIIQPAYRYRWLSLRHEVRFALARPRLSRLQWPMRIVRLEILSVQSPTFGGMSFGTAGAYEKIFARAYGEVDPSDRRNALITDINLAPRNANGMVEYSADVHIIKPVDLSKGNQRIF